MPLICLSIYYLEEFEILIWSLQFILVSMLFYISFGQIDDVTMLIKDVIQLLDIVNFWGSRIHL